MSRLIITIIAIALVCWFAAPASACINDRDTIRQERQFKSLYPDSNEQTPPSADPAFDVSTNLVRFGAPVLGIALLSGAGYLGYTRRLL